MRIIFVPLMTAILLGVSACAAGDTASTPTPLTEKQAKRVDKLLSGKVAGKPQQCLSNSRNAGTVRVSDDFLLYRVSGKLVYRNELRGHCPGLADDDDIMVVRTFGSSQCKGDHFQLVDRHSGIPGPTCVLGEFVPYETADRAS